MSLQLDKINPKFRHITDLLFFSDRMDLDLIDYRSLLKERREVHLDYLLSRFAKATSIYWEDGEKYWFNRINFIYSLNDKALTKYVEDYLESAMFSLVRNSKVISTKFDIEYVQYVELCKVKRARGESLLSIENYLVDVVSFSTLDKAINLIETFIPIVFDNINKYVEIISRKISTSYRCFELLMELEKRGFIFDHAPIIKAAEDAIIRKAHSEKRCRAFFTMLNEPFVREALKNNCNSSFRSSLIALLNYCDYQMIEEFHLKNIKNVIDLDPTLADDIAVVYADKLYQRGSGHKKANADRLIRLMKMIPQISPKKILVYLSSHNKMSDIKYVMSSFPELKKLAAFV